MPLAQTLICAGCLYKYIMSSIISKITEKIGLQSANERYNKWHSTFVDILLEGVQHKACSSFNVSQVEDKIITANIVSLFLHLVWPQKAGETTAPTSIKTVIKSLAIEQS